MIVGDPAYPLLTWLIKGYPGVISPREESFNVYLNSARVKVEMAFGRLKGRWRILLKRMDCMHSFASKIILTCCILHNFVETHKDAFFVHWLEEVKDKEKLFPQPQAEANRERNDLSGTTIRNCLMEYLINFPLRKTFLSQ